MKCDSCLNKTICKYVEDMKDKQAKLDGLETNNTIKFSPIEITIKCSKWQSNTQGSIFTKTSTIGTFNKWNR